MGYYVPGPNKGKVKYLEDTHGAQVIKSPIVPVPSGKALVCVVDNGPFEAAAYAFSKDELQMMLEADDQRPKTWLLMDEALVKKLTGFEK